MSANQLADQSVRYSFRQLASQSVAHQSIANSLFPSLIDQVILLMTLMTTPLDFVGVTQIKHESSSLSQVEPHQIPSPMGQKKACLINGVALLL